MNNRLAAGLIVVSRQIVCPVGSVNENPKLSFIFCPFRVKDVFEVSFQISRAKMKNKLCVTYADCWVAV